MRKSSPAVNLLGTSLPEGFDDGLPRMWRGFMAARIIVASVLLLLVLFLRFVGNKTDSVALFLCVGYLLLTWVVRIWGKPRRAVSRFDPQWLVTVGADVLVFSGLLFMQAYPVNFTPLFVLPVLLAAVLGSLLLALGTAATVTVVLLIDSWQMSILGNVESTSRYFQAAVTGVGLFLVAFLANQLAVRLVRQERLARVSTIAARTQAKINQLVIDTLSDGVMVVDGHGVVRAANPAAQAMLGPRQVQTGAADAYIEAVLPRVPFVLASQRNWHPLVKLAQSTLQSGAAQNVELAVSDLNGAVQQLNVRTHLVAGSDADTAATHCVLFMEDLRELEARLRTEKLAAMGRMSAAVAHEIRNPLSAITQANALLFEELQSPDHQKLSKMIKHNAKRLARIVDDVLDVSRASSQTTRQHFVPSVEDMVWHICHDWAEQHACAALLRLPKIHSSTTVVFQEDHLRRVLVNLLDNALRYASKQAESIEVSIQQEPPARNAHLMSDSDMSTLRLTVWCDASPIEQSVQKHLFEPFFTSESRSSGLGLYICRELCARHGALINYQRGFRVPDGQRQTADQEGNAFFVQMQCIPDDMVFANTMASLF
jgi:two-component system, NtrC family, sensor histidine kinase PilS